MSRKLAARLLTVLTLVFALGLLPAAAQAADTAAARPVGILAQLGQLLQSLLDAAVAATTGGGELDGATSGDGGGAPTTNGESGPILDPHG